MKFYEHKNKRRIIVENRLFNSIISYIDNKSQYLHVIKDGEAIPVEAYYNPNTKTYYFVDKTERKETDSITELLDKILRGMK